MGRGRGKYNSPSQAKRRQEIPALFACFSPPSLFLPFPPFQIWEGGGGGRFIHLLNHERGAKSGVMSVRRPTVVVVVAAQT